MRWAVAKYEAEQTIVVTPLKGLIVGRARATGA
jgi:hypothetical protein